MNGAWLMVKPNNRQKRRAGIYKFTQKQKIDYGFRFSEPSSGRHGSRTKRNMKDFANKVGGF